VPLRSIALLFVFALAACSDYRAVGQGPDSAVARFVKGGEVTVIQVTVSDVRPVRAVELDGPGGVVVPAYSIDSNRAFAARGPTFQPSLGVSGGGAFGGGNSEFGGGPSFAMPFSSTAPFGSGAAVPGSVAVTSGQIQTTALIRLPDPQDYRQNWHYWTVQIQLGDPPDTKFITFPAPAPPP
jgi:hypothetical protein